MSLDYRTHRHGCQPLSMCLTSKVVTAASFPLTHLQMTRTYVTLLLTVTMTRIPIETLMMRNQSSILSNFRLSSVASSSFQLISAFEAWLVSSPISDLLRGNLHTSSRHRVTVVCSMGVQRAK